jgi:copper chaperone NosL
MTFRRVLLIVTLTAATACAGDPPAPVPIEPGTACAFCKMIVSDKRFASEVLAPHEEPVFFDDLACLARFLANAGAIQPNTRIYVADHRSGSWIPAGRAVYTQVADTSAPMGSKIVAHESAASRDADASARNGQPIDAALVFGDVRFLEGSR